MLLAIDVGNTNIVLGLFAGEHLQAAWRLRTEREATVDELILKFSGLMRQAGLENERVTGAAVACVVPPLTGAMAELCRRLGVAEPVFADVETAGIPTEYDNPREIGADRLANAVAAWAKYGPQALLVVDFGTATTFDYVTQGGAYGGGIIAPGVLSAAEALFQKASRLPRAEVFAAPSRVIAKDTASCMNSGLVLGFAALVDGLVERARAEVGELFVLATGGLARNIAPQSKTIQAVEENLTLEGLRLIHARAEASRVR
jgi:type III pantothenate kinase